MSTLISGYITLEKLKEIAAVVEKKGEKGFRFTASVNDQIDQYKNNVQFFAEQTPEQRTAKAKKYFFANGKVFWTDGKPPVTAKSLEQPEGEPVAHQASTTTADDLPF